MYPPLARCFVFGLVLFASVLIAPALSNAKERDERKEFPRSFAWGAIEVKDQSVELHIKQVPDDRIIRIPRLHSPYKQVYLQSDEQKKPLKFKPEVKEWLVTLPGFVDPGAVVVMETVGPPQLLTRAPVVQADSSGAYVLPAHFATVHGEKLRYEPQPHKNTVGYWAVETDWCHWSVDISKPGKYAVHVLQGCGKGHGGSEVEVRLKDQSLTFIVEDTGHFQNFKDRNVGTLQVTAAGKQTLSLRPIHKAKVAVMDVRQVRLVPVR